MHSSWGASQKGHGHSAFPWTTFLGACSGCLGIFPQFVAAALILGVWQPQLSLWDALRGEISSSCLPHLQLFTPSVGCVPQRGWASPDGAAPWGAAPGSRISGAADWQNITKETAAKEGWLRIPVLLLLRAVCFTLQGMALTDVEVMIYKGEDLNIVQAALPACWLSSEDSGICCVARLQRFGCKLYLAYLFFVGV